MNINSLPSGLSSITGGQSSTQSAQIKKDINKFNDLVQSVMSHETAQTLSSSQIIESGKLNGDYTTGFSGLYTNPDDTNALPTGAAANSASVVQNKTIDKTSRLYEKSMELESYFVKIMLNTMRSSLSSSGLTGEKSYAGGMYEDMLYDEFAVSMTKNAGFGLADQIYLQLA